MAPKRARKSGVPVSAASSTAAAPLKARASLGGSNSKAGPRKSLSSRANEDDSDAENVIQSESSARKRASREDEDELDSGDESEEVNVEASLVASPSKKGAKTPSSNKKAVASASVTAPASSPETEDTDEDDVGAVVSAGPATAATKRAKKSAPASATASKAKKSPAGKKPATAESKGRKFTVKELQNKKGRKYTSTASQESEDDDVSSTSRSKTGHAGSYNWELAIPQLKPSDLGTKLTYHEDLHVKLFREGEHKRYKFERGDKIFVLPDPATLPPRSTEVDVDELDDDLWWVARILDCIKVDQSKENPDEPILGLFRVAWDYAPDHALALVGKHLHESYRKKITSYRFDEDERIASDHIDFISIESFAGFANGIATFCKITGLEVDDKDRLRDPSQRAKRTHPVVMTGFTSKATTLRKEQREERQARPSKKPRSS